MIKIKLTILLLLLSLGIYAQQALNIYNLRNCIAYSLENNPNSTVYKNQIKNARYKKMESLATYLPHISSNVSIDKNIINPATILPAGAFGATQKQVLRFGTAYSATANVQVDQVLYDYNMLIVKKLNYINTQLADVQLLKSNNEVIYNTMQAYFKVLALKEQEKLLLENIKRNNELLQVVNLQYKNGVAKEVDVNRMLVTVNNIKSKLTVLNSNKEVVLNQLKYAMGLDLKDELKIIDTLDYNTQINMPEPATFNPENIVDYKLQVFDLQLKQLNIKNRLTFFPTLSTYFRYGNNAFGMTLGEALSDWYSNSAVGIKLSVPIFEGFKKRYQLKQNRIAVSNAKENLKLAVMNFELQYKNANSQLLSSYTNLIDNKSNLNLAVEVLYSIGLQYHAGTSSLSDFLNAEYSFKEAQGNYIQSLIDFLTSRIDYEKSLGTLPEYVTQLN